MNRPAVTWCIINYNGAAHLPAAFEALRAQSWPFAETLLVDNGSEDQSLEIAASLPGLRVVPLPENRGPGAARNAGFAAAEHDLILFQDNDVRLAPDTAERLVEFLFARSVGRDARRGGRTGECDREQDGHGEEDGHGERDGQGEQGGQDGHGGRDGRGGTRDREREGGRRAARDGATDGDHLPLVVAPRVLYASDPGTIQFDSADCHFLGLMTTRNADRKVTTVGANAAETTSLVTACFLIDRSRWTGEPPFDETFGFNLEDHDFGIRAVLSGHSLWIEPAATVTHGTGTPGLSYRPGGKPTRHRVFYQTRNRWIILRKSFATRTLFVLAPALLVFELLQLIWLTTRGLFPVWWDSVRSFLRAWSRSRESRRAIQQSRRVSDRELLRDAPLPLTRHAREPALTRVPVAVADALLRGYWRIVRIWI